MAQLVIEQELADRLREIARRENRRVEEILASLLDLYTAQSDLLTAMDGMFDDEVTDLSTTVRETMDTYYKREYGLSR
ncbi:MAG TPA: hypothetical protein VJA25_13325 [Dehalococcoidia bacterium]|nr:hypothetical protein [Dehalococcoidia bacterium]